MGDWASFFGDLLWWVPWRDPLGRSRAHNRQAELRLKVALDSELQRSEDIAGPRPR